jgi:hypothetical protein
VGVTVASEVVPSLYCSFYFTSFLQFASTTGCDIHIVLSEDYLFLRLEFEVSFELSIIIWIMDMIVVIIDQGYTIHFGSFIMDA